MARKYLPILQGASLYEWFPDRNTGFDEIIEIGKQQSGQKIVRGLLQLNISQLSESFATGEIDPSATLYLNLRIAHAKDFQGTQYLEFHPVSRSWDEGTGYYAQEWKNPQDGATWQTATLTNVTWSAAGGDFISGSDSLLHEFAPNVWPPNDVRLNITQQIGKWISGTLADTGLLIKLPNTDESSSLVEANVKFFSRQTHTIFPPIIEAVWNTQVMNTDGSGLSVAPDEYSVFIKNLKPAYSSGSVCRLRIGIRPTNVIKSFSDRFKYGNQYFFPSESFIGIRDESTREMVIPFDVGSRINADTTGSYYDLRVENMYLHRTYRIFVKTQKPWGDEIIDTGNNFQVK